MGFTTREARRLILLIGADEGWLQEMRKLLNPEDWQFALADGLETLPARLSREPVHAVVVAPREYRAKDLQAVRACRAGSPGTSLVFLCSDPASAALRQATGTGPGACLAWPASPETIVRAVHRATPPHEGQRRLNR